MKGKYLEVFALGTAASIFFVQAVERGSLSPQCRKQVGGLAAVAGIAGLIGCILWALQEQRLPWEPDRAGWWIFMPRAGVSWQVLGEWTLGLCFALLVLAVMFGAPALPRLFSLAPLRFIGLISYSLYVWHAPILFVLSVTIVASALAPYLHFILLIALVLLLWCSASYFLIERPFLGWRRAARHRA